MKKFKLEEKNISQLIQGINTNKLVFIDRKKNKQFKNNYKDIIYNLNSNHYRYSDYDTSSKYRGEKIHVFSYKNLYIKVKLVNGTCKILSMHMAEYEF